MKDCVVAIDQGGHATRAIAFGLDGHRLGLALVTIATGHNALGHVEHDGEELAGSVQSALDELADHVPASRWLRAGLAVQRSTIACWDAASGQPLAPVISWQDRRNAAWLRGLARHAPRVQQLTGLPLSPHYGASKLRWCLDHEPEVRRAAAEGRLRCGPLASFLLARALDGAPFACDAANAARTLLWSPFERRWSPELLELFGIPGQLLPAVIGTASHYGMLQVRGTAVPLELCTGDQSAVPFAPGALDASAAYVNLGTGAFVLRSTDSALAAPPLLTSLLHESGDAAHHALEGTVNGAGAALDWLEHHQGAHAERLLAVLAGSALVDDAAPLFLNGVAGLGSPFWQPDFESRFIGEGEPLQECRAVLESVAFLVKANLDEMRRHLPAPLRIVASGGLAANGLLRRQLATLAGVPVDHAEDREATSRGVARLLAGPDAAFNAPPAARTEPEDDTALLARYLAWLAQLQGALGG